MPRTIASSLLVLESLLASATFLVANFQDREKLLGSDGENNLER
jgi:hypothetical protein